MNYVNIKRTNSLHTLLLYLQRSLHTITFAFFIILSSASLISDALGINALSLLRKSLLDSMYTQLHLLSYPAHQVNRTVREVSKFLSLKSENERLLKEQTQKSSAEEMAKTLSAENSRLKSLLGFISNAQIEKYVTTHLIGIDNSKTFSHSAMIPLGTEDGIKDNQAVISEHGLVGKIINAGRRFSQVLLITDINFRASVITSQTHQRAVICGNNSGVLDLLYAAENNIVPGEQVLTIGDYPCFASGLPIGKINEQNKVKPYIDWDTLFYVTIIK